MSEAVKTKAKNTKGLTISAFPSCSCPSMICRALNDRVVNNGLLRRMGVNGLYKMPQVQPSDQKVLSGSLR